MAATALYVHSYHLNEATVSGSFPKLGNCSHEEILMFPRCQGVNNIIFVYKAQPRNAKVSLCFSAQFSFHEMNSYPPEQINTTPALHVHSQRRASNFSASEVQLSSGVCVCLKHLSSFFCFMFTWCFFFFLI